MPGSSPAAAVPRSPGSGVATSSLWTPKAFIFLAAGLSFLGSIYLWFQGLREEGLFVGLWVPSILAAGALLMVGEGRRNE